MVESAGTLLRAFGACAFYDSIVPRDNRIVEKTFIIIVT